MLLHFGDFQFHQEVKLLYKENQLIPLKRNQATLLEFFLMDTKSVHSKDDILDSVWANQEVSEQVVFQTISQLRSIIGSGAIKTLSRQGYKWNWPVSEAEAKTPSALSNNSEKISLPWLSRIKLIGVTATCAILLMLVASLFIPDKHKINLIPGASPAADIIEPAITGLPAFSINYLPGEYSVAQAFDTPKLVFSQTGLPSDEWLSWGEVYDSEGKSVLHYGLSRGQIHWSGYVFANTNGQLSDALARRITQLSNHGLFSENLNHLDNVTLDKMLKEAPGDLDILLKLAQHFEDLGHFDVALSYLNKVTKQKGAENAYLAKAWWKTGKIYKMRGQYQQALTSLDKMAEALDKSPVRPLFYQYVETKAWLAYSSGDYQIMNAVLERGLQLFSGTSEEIITEKSITEKTYARDKALSLFKLQLLTSILAQKSGDDARKYHYLNQAQALLLKHQLDDSNLAIVYYHFALFARQEIESYSNGLDEAVDETFVTYLERILALPRTSHNYWVQDEAFERLVKHYQTHQNYAVALALFDNRASTPKQMLLKAEVLFSQNSHLDSDDGNINGINAEARELLENAFEQARIDYDTRTGIEAALKLYQLSQNNPSVQSEYQAYLEVNANTEWLNKHFYVAL